MAEFFIYFYRLCIRRALGRCPSADSRTFWSIQLWHPGVCGAPQSLTLVEKSGVAKLTYACCGCCFFFSYSQYTTLAVMPAASSLVFATALAGGVYDRHATPPADGGDGPAVWYVNSTCTSLSANSFGKARVQTMEPNAVPTYECSHMYDSDRSLCGGAATARFVFS